MRIVSASDLDSLIQDRIQNIKSIIANGNSVINTWLKGPKNKSPYAFYRGSQMAIGDIKLELESYNIELQHLQRVSEFYEEVGVNN